MKRPKKHQKALRIWCIILAILLLGVSGTWFLAYHNGWWFYNDEYLTRKLGELARNYYADYHERIFTESGAEKATSYLRNLSERNGMLIPLGDIFVGKNANETALKARFLEESGCNKKQTVAQITPKEPFGASDIDVAVKLVCTK
ncbi:MAG: hypothetical protein LBM12_02890 [Candidatus Nomurabacteria bacterium]|jgi:hypothetical protein|nr:hypothetical protein [Candidatus Nomurabacteria bacterium]